MHLRTSARRRTLRVRWLLVTLPLAVLGCSANRGWSADVVGWGLNEYGQLSPPAGLTGVAAIATAGGFADFEGAYSLALLDSGNIVPWGLCHEGQTAIPPDLTNAVAIAAGPYHSVALGSDGRVTAWGSNAYGQTNVPVALSNVVAVTGGYYHCLALTDQGTVVGWGAGGPGSMGWPNFGQTTIPVGLSNVVAIATGLGHSLALKADGRVVGWGDNPWGQATIPVGLSNVVAITAGDNHSMALRSDGTVAAWGWNFEGISTVPEALGNVVAIAAGNRVSLAIQADGKVAGWGFWDTGDVPPGLDSALAIDAGYLHCLALGSEPTPTGLPVIIGPPFLVGTVDRPLWSRVLARNRPTSFGATGLPSGLALDPATGILKGVPTVSGRFAVTFSATNSLGLGSRTTMLSVNLPLPAIRSGGMVQAYPGQPFEFNVLADNDPGDFRAEGLPVGLGIESASGRITGTAPFSPGDYAVSLTASNAYGLGTGSLIVRVTAVAGWGADNLGQANGPAPLTGVRSIATGGSHNLALLKNGALLSWGSHPQSSIPDGLSNVVAVAAGGAAGSAIGGHSVVLKSDGTVVSWGNNSHWQTNVPSGLSNVVAVAAGGIHSLALKDDETVVGWGAVGRGGSGQATIPAGLSNIIAIAAGGSHSLALARNGIVFAWGGNAFGQTNVPAGLTDVLAIAAGGSHSVALTGAGTVLAWGNNASGQTNVPAGLSNVVAVSAGEVHSLALTRNGGVVAWGGNASGQTNAPAGLTNVLAIAAGGAHSLALVQDLPQLSIRVGAPDEVIIGWPTAAHAWVPERTGNLAASDWGILPAPRTTNGTEISALVSPVAGESYFRLRPN